MTGPTEKCDRSRPCGSYENWPNPPTQHYYHAPATTSDPSDLTVRMLLRELANLREVVEARMDGNDRIVELLQAGQDRRKDEVSAEVQHLSKLHGEKFASIQTQFQERDTRTDQTSKDSKVAVDAALQAAKEAVSEQNKSSALAIGKSETSTGKQIDQIALNIAGMTSNLNDKIDDVKNRMNVIDGRTKGGQDNKDDHRSNIAIAVSVIMTLITIGGLIFSSGRGQQQASQPSVVYQVTPSSTTTK